MLDQLPKRLQPEALDKRHKIGMAPTKKTANQAFDWFVKTYQARYPAAVERTPVDDSGITLS